MNQLKELFCPSFIICVDHIQKECGYQNGNLNILRRVLTDLTYPSNLTFTSTIFNFEIVKYVHEEDLV